MRNITNLLIIIAFICGYAAAADAGSFRSIDLSSSESGREIVVPGAGFAQNFAGQPAAGGTGSSGSLTNPLKLLNEGGLEIIPLAKSKTIVSPPEFKGPLSVLLDSDAVSASWTMGHGQPPSSVTIDFYSSDGRLVKTITDQIMKGYNTYTYNGFGTFRGFTVYNNTDPAGLRFYNFMYEPE